MMRRQNTTTIKPRETGGDIPSLLLACKDAVDAVNAAAAQKLVTNAVLASAQASFRMALTAFMAAEAGGNAQQIQAAATALLQANANLASAEAADALATQVLVTAQQAEANAQQALNAAIAAAIGGG